MKKIITHAVALLVGIIIGVSGLLGWYLYHNRTTSIMKSKRTIHTRNGIIIPAGTELIYEHNFPEGVECAKLYINMRPSFAREYFEFSVENKSFLIIPYWVNGDLAE